MLTGVRSRFCSPLLHFLQAPFVEDDSAGSTLPLQPLARLASGHNVSCTQRRTLATVPLAWILA